MSIDMCKDKKFIQSEIVPILDDLAKTKEAINAAFDFSPPAMVLVQKALRHVRGANARIQALEQKLMGCGGRIGD